MRPELEQHHLLVPHSNKINVTKRSGLAKIPPKIILACLAAEGSYDGRPAAAKAAVRIADSATNIWICDRVICGGKKLLWCLNQKTFIQLMVAPSCGPSPGDGLEKNPAVSVSPESVEIEHPPGINIAARNFSTVTSCVIVVRQNNLVPWFITRSPRWWESRRRDNFTSQILHRHFFHDIVDKSRWVGRVT